MDDELALDAEDAVAPEVAVVDAPPSPERAMGLRLRPVAIAFVAAVMVAMAIGGAVSLVRGPQGPWRGEYYEGKEFEGEATIRYARKLEFEWDKAAPFRGMPKDKWSVVYTTCLEVDEEAEYRFRMTSDDGSRLYIDGERIIDNWGAHSPRTRSGKYVLEPGTYELEVEYFESSHGAELKLVVAIGEDGEHETISPKTLRQPSDDEDNPCG